jgi:hypothetical protein
MKLLFDHHLSYRSVPALASLHSGLVHVRDLGLSMRHRDSLSQAVSTPTASGQAGSQPSSRGRSLCKGLCR